MHCDEWMKADLPAITRSMMIPRTRLANEAVTTPQNVRNIILSKESLVFKG